MDSDREGQEANIRSRELPAPSNKGPEASNPKSLAAALPLLKDYVVPALSIVGVVVYALVRLAYLLFYLRLRTTPEEVGYGYSRILAESVVGSVELAVLVFLPFLALGLALHAAVAVWRRHHPRANHRNTDVHKGPRANPIHRIAIRAFIGALAVVAIGLPMLASWQGKLAQHGQTVRNVYFVVVPNLPVLAVQAVPALVVWTRPDAQQQFNLSDRHCLLYLGIGNGIDVFYDVQSGESLRVPSSDIAISFPFEYFVNNGEGCGR